LQVEHAQKHVLQRWVDINSFWTHNIQNRIYTMVILYYYFVRLPCNVIILLLLLLLLYISTLLSHKRGFFIQTFSLRQPSSVTRHNVTILKCYLYYYCYLHMLKKKKLCNFNVLYFRLSASSFFFYGTFRSPIRHNCRLKTKRRNVISDQSLFYFTL